MGGWGGRESKRLFLLSQNHSAAVKFTSKIIFEFIFVHSFTFVSILSVSSFVC
jgi:hypothetical protein